jgi:ATP-dependent RNA helicase RhlE
LAEPLLRALDTKGYAHATPIQAKAIPELLKGKDMLGIAQTGTGKTAAFALPLLQRLHEENRNPTPRHCRALILAPTRELVIQIADSLKTYGRFLRLTSTMAVGGIGYNGQVKAMAKGVDVLVATPGRLLDLIKQGFVSLAETRAVVLDEADRMLDMGFIHDIRRLLALMPRDRQSLLFSATMPADIARLAQDMLRDPVRVEVTPQQITVERIDQRVYHVDGGKKRALLIHLLGDPALSRVIVFTRTKHGANRVSEHLTKAGVTTQAIHGNKSQGARQRALLAFKASQIRVLVATDIAARGIDVAGVSHVINYELPNEPENYVHRIGRTARAGTGGIALSLCAADERPYLRNIEKLTRRSLQTVELPTGLPNVETSAEEKTARPAYGHRQNDNRGQRRAVPARPAQRPGRARSRQRSGQSA